ncbi:Rpn family recombination-promoting nuclease/putative transposase [Gloeothece verrucosa]|uniref:DUF4351 domain-containing protein n=1 Tax=Gloeothece verrucosa (strain PCC 7822) TaxID=497965 RepID=E0UNK2_GLOV7|nr:Rpn family recombination-promoting nuclease/putative transposase [Gloeothece verrucosa]ADN18532.1 conserved hypothetical protein [Gloeothece verrucosa PCC 7822]
MKTDSIFYQIFLNFPKSFFDLIGEGETEVDNYQFTSQEIKQLSFRLDGLFMPTIEETAKPLYLVEVQFQPDPDLYYRLFSEFFLFLKQYKPPYSWQIVVIYPTRSVEREQSIHFRDFLSLSSIRRIYLDKLEEAANSSLGINVIKLVVESEQQAVAKAQALIELSKNQLSDETIQKSLIDLIESIIVYKFPLKTREEIEAMFNLSDLKQTRVYQEALTEGRQQEGFNLVLRQLNRRVGQISPIEIEQIQALSIEQLENLGEALLDFSSVEDLRRWLEEN